MKWRAKEYLNIGDIGIDNFLDKIIMYPVYPFLHLNPLAFEDQTKHTARCVKWSLVELFQTQDHI